MTRVWEMGGIGLEHPPLTHPKTPISHITRTESGTVNDDHDSKCPKQVVITLTVLAEMTKACEGLSDETKTKILNLIDPQIPSPKSPRKDNNNE